MQIEQEHAIASQSVLERALELDSSIILVKSVGSVPEERATELSDFDFVVFSPSSWFNLTTRSSKRSFKRSNIYEPRSIHVHWHNLQDHLGITRTPDWNIVSKMRLSEYIHYFTWYGLLSIHDPIYITEAGKHLIKNAHLFVNRNTIQDDIITIQKVHTILSSTWTSERHKYAKHAKSNLLGLQMCKMAINGNLIYYDVTMAPATPDKETYCRDYNSLYNEITDSDLTKIPERNNRLITDLLYEIQVLNDIDNV